MAFGWLIASVTVTVWSVDRCTCNLSFGDVVVYND